MTAGSRGGPPAGRLPRLAAVTATLATTLVLLLLCPAPAQAHARLVSGTPGDGVRLTEAPDEVVVGFSEAVIVNDNSLTVRAAEGGSVTDGDPERDPGDSRLLRVDLRPDLPDGAYVVTYRVVSKDSHPITGAWSFAVGDAEPVEVAGGDEDVPYQGLSTLTRGLGYAGVVAALGTAVFVLLCWPAGRGRRAAHVVVGGLTVVVVAGVAQLLVQGVAATGRPVTDAIDPQVLAAAAAGPVGQATSLRLATAALLIVLVDRLVDRPARPALVAGGLAATGLLASFGLAGHARGQAIAPLAVAVDGVHVAAMATWLGGLAVLALVVLRRPAEGAVEAVRRFSPVALACVVALAATGALQAWQQVRDAAALPSTGYGRLLMVKLALVAVVLLVATASRRWVRRGRDDLPALRRSVTGEATIAGAALALTALLAGTPPAAATYSPVVEVSAPLTAGRSVEAVLDPARTGPARLQVRSRAAGGALLPAERVDARLTRVGPSGAAAGSTAEPLPVPLNRQPDGSWASTGLQLPTSGDWQLTLTVQSSETDTVTTTADVTIR